MLAGYTSLRGVRFGKVRYLSGRTVVAAFKAGVGIWSEGQGHIRGTDWMVLLFRHSQTPREAGIHK